MKRAVLIAVAACRPAPAPALTNAVAPVIERRVPFAPCPLDIEGEIEHELFRACAPPPYHEPIAPCPRGECPRPCRVDLAGGGSQKVTYDERGRLLLAEGNEDRLLDRSCTYEGTRVVECHLLYDGRPITTQKVWRDRAGLIIGTSNGEPMVGYDPHYKWANGRVVALESSMGNAAYTYAGDRVIEIDRDDMGEKERITYRYDTAGDVIASSRDGAYVYDARKRLVSAGKLKLEWDDRDRLIRSTAGGMTYTYTYECK